MDCPPEYPVASSSTLTLPLNLPSYSPSGASPDYVAEPSEGERRLDFVARPHVTERPHGTFTKKIRKITVSLHDQEEGVDIPTYARNAIVRGQLQLDDAENILSVAVKVSPRVLLLMLSYNLINVAISSLKADRIFPRLKVELQFGPYSRKHTRFGSEVIAQHALRNFHSIYLSLRHTRTDPEVMLCHLRSVPSSAAPQVWYARIHIPWWRSSRNHDLDRGNNIKRE